MEFDPLRSSIESNIVATLQLDKPRRDCYFYEKGRVVYAEERGDITAEQLAELLDMISVELIS